MLQSASRRRWCRYVGHWRPGRSLARAFPSARDASELDGIARLTSPARDRAAAALAARIDRESLFAVYGYGAIPELVSPRLGCIVHQPEYAGVDLAALCLRGTS